MNAAATSGGSISRIFLKGRARPITAAVTTVSSLRTPISVGTFKLSMGANDNTSRASIGRIHETTCFLTMPIILSVPMPTMPTGLWPT